MTDAPPPGPAWGDDAADLRAVVASQRDIIERLQAELAEERATVERLEAELPSHRNGHAPAQDSDAPS